MSTLPARGIRGTWEGVIKLGVGAMTGRGDGVVLGRWFKGVRRSARSAVMKVIIFSLLFRHRNAYPRVIHYSLKVM